MKPMASTCNIGAATDLASDCPKAFCISITGAWLCGGNQPAPVFATVASTSSISRSAKATARRLLEIKPDFSISRDARNAVWSANTVELDRLIDGLREAGVPAREARRRSEATLARIQGALVVSRGLGSTVHFKRVLKELPGTLLGDA